MIFHERTKDALRLKTLSKILGYSLASVHIYLFIVGMMSITLEKKILK
jgi:hypothetical protein